MNKLYKTLFAIFFSFLIVFTPITLPFSEMAKVQANNIVNIDAAPKGTTIAPDSALAQALIEAHENQIELLINQMVQERPLIRVSQRDVKHVRGKDEKTGKQDSGDGEIDRRILKTFNYLVTPRELGGAGYRHLKVQRLMKGYDSPFSHHKMSREYPEGKDPNLSVHSYGQAADISEIGYIYSTIKEFKAIGTTKKKKQPLMPIKVAWQSEKGFEASGGIDTYNQSLHGLFAEYGFNSLDETMVLEVSELFGIEIDLNNYSLNNLDDLARILAIQWLVASAEMPELDLSSINLSDLSWGELSKEIGRAYLAEMLDLDTQGLRGNNLTEIKRNLGRAEVENRLGLPDGALETVSGSSEDILRQLALRRLEDDLELPRNSLKNIATDGAAQKLFKDTLGMYPENQPVRLDAVLGMPPGGNYTNILKGAGGNINQALFEIGSYFASQILVNNVSEQNLVYKWIMHGITKIGDLEIDETRLAGNVGLKTGDVENLFRQNASFAVFNRIGETALLDGLGHAALENYDPLAQTFADFEFYHSTATNLQSKLEDLTSNSEVGSIANTLLGIISGLRVITSGDLGDIENDIRRVNQAARELQNLSDQQLNSLQDVGSLINSFVEGVNLPFISNLNSTNLDIPDLNIFGTDISSEDLFNALLSDNPSETLTEIGIEIISSQWEFSWGLPEDTIRKLIQGEPVNVKEELGEIASDFINDELGTNLSGEDLEKIFNGDFSSLTIIGGAMLDQALNLPENSIVEAINQGGNAEEILARAGSLLIGQFLGIDMPISFEENFIKNIGKGTIETRLGIPNINSMVSDLDIERVGEIFHLELNGADSIDQEVIDKSKDGIEYISILLGFGSDTATIEGFLLGSITASDFSKDVGEKTIPTITTDAIMNYLDLDEDFKTTIQSIIEIITEGTSPTVDIAAALFELAGINLEETIGLKQGEIQEILDDNSKFDEVIVRAGMRLFEEYVEQIAGVDISGVTEMIENYFLTDNWSPEDFENVLLNIAKEIVPAEYGEAFSALTTGLANGNTKETMNTFSAALMEKFYNETFSDISGSQQITFTEIKNAITADPVLVNSWMAENGIDPATASDEQLKIAERESRNQAQRYLQYKLLDAKMHEVDGDIPQNFTQIMFEGTEGERRTILINFVIDKYAGEIEGMSANELKAAIDSGNYGEPVRNYFENKLRDLTGINFASGTVDAFLEGDFASALDINANLISRYVDGYLDLPSGTTQTVWSAYDQYKKAFTVYKDAIATAGDNAEAIATAKNNFNTTIANIAVTLVTFAFQKQFAQLDQKFGLPAGTTSAIVGMGLTWLVTGAIPIVGILGLGYTLLFGTYKVRMYSTPCNYYPKMGDPPAWMKMKNPDHQDELGILPSSFPYCPGEWAYKPKFGSKTFKDIAIASAQYKVAMLMGDLLYMNDWLEKQGDEIAGKNNNMLPSQILTLREEDRNRYLYKVVKEYGKTASERGWRGIIISDKVWDVVHIGF